MSPYRIILLASVALVARPTTVVVSATSGESSKLPRSLVLDISDFSKKRRMRADDGENVASTKEERAEGGFQSLGKKVMNSLSFMPSTWHNEEEPARLKVLVGLDDPNAPKLGNKQLGDLIEASYKKYQNEDFVDTTKLLAILELIPVDRLAEMMQKHPRLKELMAKVWVSEGKTVEGIKKRLGINDQDPKALEHPNLDLFIAFKRVLNAQNFRTTPSMRIGDGNLKKVNALIRLDTPDVDIADNVNLALWIDASFKMSKHSDFLDSAFIPETLDRIPIKRLAELTMKYPHFKELMAKCWFTKGKTVTDIKKLLGIDERDPKLEDHLNLDLFRTFEQVLNRQKPLGNINAFVWVDGPGGNIVENPELHRWIELSYNFLRHNDVSNAATYAETLDTIPIGRLAELTVKYPHLKELMAKVWVKQGKTVKGIKNLLVINEQDPKVLDHPNLDLFITFKRVLKENNRGTHATRS
uniref:Uncharacterized protein n=1 Tax=Peronospora matthiolae TaxID=2874970 RepID=A0AAV1ULM6_9STRA